MLVTGRFGIATLVLTLAACGRIGFQTSVDAGLDAPPADAPPSDGAVGDERLPLDGAVIPVTNLTAEGTYGSLSWGSYVELSDPTRDLDSQPGTACTASSRVDGRRCIHLGERIRVATSKPSCDGLVLQDRLGAFRWQCRQESDAAVFYSQGLLPDRSLSDLLEGAAWRPNQAVLLEDGTPIDATPSAVWHSNEVVPVPAGGGVLDAGAAAAGRVWVVAADMTVPGVTIGGDGVSLVVMPGATLRVDPAGPQSCATADATTCLVFAEGRRFIWLEGSFEGVRDITLLRGVLLRDVRTSVLRGVTVSRTGSRGIELTNVHESILHQVGVQSSGAEGIFLGVGSHNRFERVRIADAARRGLSFQGTFGESDALLVTMGNVVHDLWVSNAGMRAGVDIACGTSNNPFTRVFATSNERTGIISVCNDATTFSHVTAVMNGARAVDIDQVSRNVVVQAVASASLHGLEVDFGAGPGRYAQIVATDNEGAGFNIDARDGEYHGTLLVGNNGTAPCVVAGRSQPGLIDATCTLSGTDGSSDYGAELSTAILRTGRTITGELRGRVESDDPQNRSDDGGSAASPTDWLRFASPYRAWGNDGPSVTDLTTRGRCLSDCRIWDLRVAAAATAIRDRVGDGATAEPARPDQPCPSWLRGDVSVTDYRRAEILDDGSGNDDGACQSGEACTTPTPFLLNALEIMHDLVGDEDGLCESGESCIASPNYGAFQGEGRPVGTCTYDAGPGPVTDVSMYVR